MRRRRSTTPVYVLAALMPLVLVLGIWLGSHPDNLPGAVRDTIVDDEDTRVLTSAIDRISDDYYRKVPKKDLVDAALKGAVASLGDQFSAYLTEKEFKAMRESEEGRFSGIGTTVQGVKQGLRITRVYDDSPASRAGLRAGDVITAANGRKVAALPEDAAVARIKGPAGTDVKLTYLRKGKERSATVTRATVVIPVVSSEIEEAGGKKIGVIRLDQFSSGAHAEIFAAVRRAQTKGAKGLVLDLRNNPGGLVKEAQLVASAFLKEGPVVTTRGRVVPTDTLDATGDPVAKDLPMVVLVNRGTASAAEIVTGALQDRDRARVVGQATFGKGVFQEVVPLENGGALDLTLGQYFTPDGKNLGKGVERGKGVLPDVKAQDEPETPKDEGLQGALDALAPKL